MADTPERTDPYMLLAGAKLHLADHQPMTADDEEAWLILDGFQAFVWKEQRQREEASRG